MRGGRERQLEACDSSFTFFCSDSLFCCCYISLDRYMMPSILDANAPELVASPKRKASDLHLDISVKRRSPRACLVCRNRKVRCDAVQSGVPCNNCRLDNVPCVLSTSTRRKTKSTPVDCQTQSPEHDSDRANDIPVSLTFEGPALHSVHLGKFAHF